LVLSPDVALEVSPAGPAGKEEKAEMNGNDGLPAIGDDEADKLRYRIVLSVRHPNIDHTLITSRIGLEPRMGWTAGAERRTIAGTLLPGVSKTTAWRHSFDVKGERLFSEGVSKMLSVLLRNAELVHELINSGASIGLFVYLPGSVNIGDVLSWEELGQLASLKVNFGVEVFRNFK
jgi:hypothetical protein